jgi:hypothetical protein
MHGRPIWGPSVWGGFICVLLSLSLLMHGSPEASVVMLMGALVLVGWAAWLSHRKR